MNIGKVIYTGTNRFIKKPMIINEEWVIPLNWVVLDKSLEDRPDEIYNKDGEVIKIIEHVQILHFSNGVEYRASIIKPNKILNQNDKIIY